MVGRGISAVNADIADNDGRKCSIEGKRQTRHVKLEAWPATILRIDLPGRRGRQALTLRKNTENAEFHIFD
jgi:hypothetical protein